MKNSSVPLWAFVICFTSFGCLAVELAFGGDTYKISQEQMDANFGEAKKSSDKIEGLEQIIYDLEMRGNPQKQILISAHKNLIEIERQKISELLKADNMGDGTRARPYRLHSSDYSGFQNYLATTPPGSARQINGKFESCTITENGRPTQFVCQKKPFSFVNSSGTIMAEDRFYLVAKLPKGWCAAPSLSLKTVSSLYQCST
ncbi:MAG: hypothetical protein A2X86_22270 [Bdellovibrionales bacterium GWA2_49_15]|nr:MAG: hypothetical protein A2X86_22270 [Bdellovibrionales bacterium GWA2_49_15]HAZ14795.1 hypothetical protein [Bdellovibrionales bacterium]